MTDYGRRIVVDAGFDVVVAETIRAIRTEGLQMIDRFDVRSHIVRALGHDFRQYLLIQAWSPECAFETLQHDLDLAAVLATTFAIYELADGETAVVATEPLGPVVSDAEFRREQPAIASIAAAEADRVARVLTRVRNTTARGVPVALTA